MSRRRPTWAEASKALYREPILPEARTWAELTRLDADYSREIHSDVIAGRRPVSELPEWHAAMHGDREALDAIIRCWDTRVALARR